MVAAVAAAAFFQDARASANAACSLVLAAPHAVTVKIVASSTPATGRNRSLVMSLVTRDLGIWLGPGGAPDSLCLLVFGNGENVKSALRFRTLSPAYSLNTLANTLHSPTSFRSWCQGPAA